MSKISEKLCTSLAHAAREVAIRANGATSWIDSYQPEEPESVRKAAEARRQAKLAKIAAKKSK